jgi:adenylate cyclase
VVERRLAAILFTDIVGYTAAMAESEERGLRARDRHRAIVGPLVERYRGEVIEARGDESLSVFPNALDAVQCALAIDEVARQEGEPRLHVGVHLGDIVVHEGEISGDGVNIAARICALTEGGGVCVSGDVYRSIRNQPDIEAVFLGERQLKNVGQPVAVYELGRPGATGRRRSPGARRVAVAVVLGLASMVGAWWASTQWERERAPHPIRSIAVLPLESLSADPEQEFFAVGMTDALIGDLAKIESLRVVSPRSVMRHKYSERPLSELARELDVDVVVEGSVLRAGDRVRITAQLIEASSDRHLWSGSYEDDLSDVLRLQAEVAQAVAREIAHELAPLTRARLTSDRAVNPAAFADTLKGFQLVRSVTPTDHGRSIGYFERAIEADSEYALAYAGLAWAYT